MENWAAARRVLFLTVFIDLMGYGLVVPVLAFCAKQYGASGATLGLILGSFSLMQFFFAPVWGRLSDRVGRRPVLIGSLCGTALGFLTFAFASSVAALFAASSLAALFAARIITGITTASIPAAQAYISDTTDGTSRAKGMASISLALGLGLILGPPIGGLLSSLGTERGISPSLLPGAAAALLSTTALLMAVFLLPESLQREARQSERRWLPIDHQAWTIFFRSRDLRLGGGALAVIMCTLASLAPILVLVGRDRFGLTAGEVGYLLGLMGVVVVVLQLVAVHRLTSRLGEVGTAMVGAGALALGLLIVPTTTARGALVVAACLMGVGQGLCNPTLSSYISKVAPASHRGGILGVATSLNALARVMGPPLAGLAYDAFRTPGALLSQAAIVGVAMLLAMRLIVPPRRSAAVLAPAK
jgi:MFS family permease